MSTGLAFIVAWLAVSAVSMSTAAAGTVGSTSTVKLALLAASQAPYIVRFVEPALGSFNTTPSGAAGFHGERIPLKKYTNGRTRLDVKSVQAISYLAYLRDRQNQHLADVAASIRRTPATIHPMQHALNAAILLLSPDEARQIASTPGIVAVDADQQMEVASDIGPRFTGATSVWLGTLLSQDSIFPGGFEKEVGYLGDGVVVGMIDGGYNSLSPSFRATDANGYVITNPLGHDVFLGQCDVPAISFAGCNDKVIGVYDEAGLTSGLSYWVYSVEDTTGHGSHTASTAAGNERTAIFDGYSARITGVAPHANLVIYRACSPYTACSYTATVAAVDHAIADGVVDVLNFSISNTQGAWDNPIANAFLAATDAGIFVAAAAGNTSASQPEQIAGTVMNTSPWIATVGAGTHTGGAVVQGMRGAVQPDELAAFSLLGPSVPKEGTIKPDLQAPGVNNLAASYDDGTPSGPGRVAMMQGTSAATAHVTGSAALLLGMHPDWTPMETRSALMMTALESGLTKADGVTPSDFFDRGSGRVREFLASRAGLVMDETADNMTNANPWTLGGDPSALNLSSMENSACAVACSFYRWFRSTQDHAVTWTASVIAGPNPGFSSLSVTPAKITLKAFSSSPVVTIKSNTGNLPADGAYHFAEVVLTPDDPKLAPLHLSVAVAVPSI